MRYTLEIHTHKIYAPIRCMSIKHAHVAQVHLISVRFRLSWSPDSWNVVTPRSAGIHRHRTAARGFIVAFPPDLLWGRQVTAKNDPPESTRDPLLPSGDGRVFVCFQRVKNGPVKLRFPAYQPRGSLKRVKGAGRAGWALGERLLKNNPESCPFNRDLVLCTQY